MGSAASSLKHTFRERETLNANADLTPENKHYEAKSTDQAMGKLRENLPTKRRKDAVIAVEYMMSASPEWWQNADKTQQEAFFEASKEWLQDKYGKAKQSAAAHEQGRDRARSCRSN